MKLGCLTQDPSQRWNIKNILSLLYESIFPIRHCYWKSGEDPWNEKKEQWLKYTEEENDRINRAFHCDKKEAIIFPIRDWYWKGGDDSWNEKNEQWLKYTKEENDRISRAFYCDKKEAILENYAINFEGGFQYKINDKNSARPIKSFKFELKDQTKEKI